MGVVGRLAVGRHGFSGGAQCPRGGVQTRRLFRSGAGACAGVGRGVCPESENLKRRARKRPPRGAARRHNKKCVAPMRWSATAGYQTNPYRQCKGRTTLAKSKEYCPHYLSILNSTCNDQELNIMNHQLM